MDWMDGQLTIISCPRIIFPANAGRFGMAPRRRLAAGEWHPGCTDPIALHRGLQFENLRAESHRRLASVLIHHHRHALAIYEFVSGALNGDIDNDCRLDTLEHARLLEIWSDELDSIQLKVSVGVQVAIQQYLGEVSKIARVVRLESCDLDTSSARLTASLDAVLHSLESLRDRDWAVDKRHSDTLS